MGNTWEQMEYPLNSMKQSSSLAGIVLSFGRKECGGDGGKLLPALLLLLLVSAVPWATSQNVSEKPPKYVSTSRIIVGRPVRADNQATAGEDIAIFYGTQAELLKSAEVKKRAISRVDALHPELVADSGVELEVVQLPKTSVFLMRAIGKSGSYVQAFLDACMDEYLATHLDMSSGRGNREQTIADQLIRLEKELRQNGEELYELTKDNADLLEAGKATGSYLSQMNQKLGELKMQFNSMELLSLDQALENPQFIPWMSGVNLQAETPESSAAAMGYLKAKKKLAELTYQRRERKDDGNSKNQSIGALDAEIATTESLTKMYKEQWSEALKIKREGLRIIITSTQELIKRWEVKANEITKGLAERKKIESTIERNKVAHARLLVSLHNEERAKIIVPDLSILERASPAVLMR